MNIEDPGFRLDARTKDNKTMVEETSRPLNTTMYFTSEGDDISDPTKIGGGEMLSIVHDIGGPLVQSIYLDFNIKENRTYLHEGYVMWKDASFDVLTLEIVPIVTTTTSGTNTYFNSYSGYLIVPAAGDGTLVVQPQDMKLVENPINFFGVRDPAFWNADYNTTTHAFENLTPAPLGNGTYNMFNTEIVLNRFVNHMLLLKDGFMMLQSAESNEMGCNMRVKLTIDTNDEDHNWRAACLLTLHRAKNC